MHECGLVKVFDMEYMTCTLHTRVHFKNFRALEECIPLPKNVITNKFENPDNFFGIQMVVHMTLHASKQS